MEIEVHAWFCILIHLFVNICFPFFFILPYELFFRIFELVLAKSKSSILNSLYVELVFSPGKVFLVS